MQPTPDMLEVEKTEITDHIARPASLAEAARGIVCEADVLSKVAAAKSVAKLWFSRTLATSRPGHAIKMPERPGRPPRPELLAPRHMPKRSCSGARGRFALLHSLAHIELSAVDMTWDLIARFGARPMPRAFFDDWVQVGLEEAKHFELLYRRLNDLGGCYGDLPAHDGLWQAAQDTGHNLLARLAIVPLVLEARGLDVGPEMIRGLQDAGDQPSADILKIIYRDEKKHVAAGMRWFRYMCRREGRLLEPTYHRLVRQYFRAPMRPPFNSEARSQAGLTPGFYKPLTAFGAPP